LQKWKKKQYAIADRRREIHLELFTLDEKENEISELLNTTKNELRNLMQSLKQTKVVAEVEGFWGEKAKIEKKLPTTYDPNGTVRQKKPKLTRGSILTKNLLKRKKETVNAKPGVLECDEVNPDDFFSPWMERAPELSKKMESLELIPPKDYQKVLAKFEGPNAPEKSVVPSPADVFQHVLYGKNISTYPQSAKSSENREGDPVCDRYVAELHLDRAIIGLADGCNWGKRVYEAAKAASLGFLKHLSKHNPHCKDIRGIGRDLIRSVTEAHNAIIEGKEDIWEAGTSTLIGGITFKSNLKEHPWIFVCVSVGDCKAFLYSRKQRTVKDITIGNRTNLTDAKDPGGRIGPFLNEGTPDLRNLDLYFCFPEEGDVIFLCSDGVHDNFDPQQLGLPPSKFSIDAETWEDAEKKFPEKTESEKNIFRETKLAEVINGEDQVQDICENILDYCFNTTKSSRDFMEQFPDKKLPSNYSQYPGKMDHTTILAVSVGDYTNLLQES